MKANSRLDDGVFAELDREIIRELRSLARSRRDRWVSTRVISGTLIRRTRGAWEMARAQGLTYSGDKWRFARDLVLSRIKHLADAGEFHSTMHYTPSGLERPGFMIPMVDLTLTPADREWLAAMHIQWEFPSKAVRGM